MKKISNQLKQDRLRRKMTQKAYAKWLGIGYDAFIQIEHNRNEPRAKTIAQIMKKVKLTFV